jgi:hypothetical protein
MSETQPLDRSFRGWYGRTIGKWWIITQAAAWVFYGWLVIPIAYGVWRYMMWADDWYKTHGKEAAARFDANHTWVEPTVTKRGRIRRGYWRRK